MNTIYNHLKNDIDNHIRGCSKKELFVIKTLTNPAKPYRIIYNITFQDVMFLIEVEYINNQIEFSFSCEIISSITALFEISDFVKHVESMPQEDLKRKFEFSLRK